MSAPVNVLSVMSDGASDYDESGHDGLADDMREARDAVVDMILALERIKRRAVLHPDDDDADRKRNLYHCEALAAAALARVQGGAK